VLLLRRFRRTAIWLSGPLFVFSCALDVAPPRFPAGQGWVISALQSDDLHYDGDTREIVAGSVTVVLADGTSAVITSDTRLDGICQELLPPPTVAMPCWLQVGLATSDGIAEWATALRPVGDTGQPLTWNQDHDRYHAVIAGHEILREITGDALIFDNGLVLTLGARAPVVTGCTRGDELASAMGETAFALLNVATGEVVTVGCTPQV
jgi:hypothetical protein